MYCILMYDYRNDEDATTNVVYLVVKICCNLNKESMSKYTPCWSIIKVQVAVVVEFSNS